MRFRKTKRQMISAVDTAWLHMDSPTNLAVITGVISFSKPLDFERLIATMDARLLTYRRFRQRVHEPLIGPACWEDDPYFDIANHIHAISLPEPANHEVLQAFVSELMSRPLDYSRPLWDFYYVDNYEEGSALVCRMHHSLADGIALVQVLLSTADMEPDAPWPEPPESPYEGLSPLARLFVPAVIATRKMRQSLNDTRHLVYESFENFLDVEKRRSLAKLGMSGSLALGKLLLMLPDRKTVLKGNCSVPKKAVWTKAISVDEVKAIGHAMDSTVNDVLLTVMTGALRRYMEIHQDQVDGVNVRAIIPVNLRPPGEIRQLGNQFGLVFLSLPIGIEDPVRRLKIMKKRMDQIKSTPEAVVAFGILNFMGMSPGKVEDLIRYIFGLKGSMVVTNVPGPRRPLYLAGEMITGLMFWVPTPANLGLGISIISYSGEVAVGVATDKGIIPDPETIVAAFDDEFELLRSHLRSSHEAGVQKSQPGQERETDEIELKVSDDETGDDINEQVDILADEQDVDSSEDAGDQPGRCQAMTKKGTRCKNRALPGLRYCRVHNR